MDEAPLAALHAGSSAVALKRRLADLARANTKRTSRSRAGAAATALVAPVVLVPWKPVQQEPDLLQTPVSMAIKDATVEVVALTIALDSGFVALTPPEVSNKTVSVNFRDVPAIEALRQVAAAADLRLVRVPYATATPAYMLLPPGHPDPVQVFTRTDPPDASLAIRGASARLVMETVAIDNDDNFIADLAQFRLEEHLVPGGKPTWILKPRR